MEAIGTGLRRQVQLTLEQCGFELSRSTYTYFSIVSTIVLDSRWLVESVDAEELRILRTNYKLYVD